MLKIPNKTFFWFTRYRRTAWAVLALVTPLLPIAWECYVWYIHGPYLPNWKFQIQMFANSPFNHHPLFSLQFMVSRQASGVASVYPPDKTNQNIIGLDAKERIHEASRRILINVIAATCWLLTYPIMIDQDWWFNDLMIQWSKMFV